MADDTVSRAAELIRDARSVTVLTGAGVSAASGISTFRGADGLWKNFRAETLATPEAFARDPRLVWEWYDWRRGLIREARPNPAHEVLARWTRERGTTVVTQNVDGLYERAGTERIIRLHGSIWHVRCWAACPAGAVDWVDEAVPLPALPPTCPHCGALVRPGVVWFGESLDPSVIGQARASAAACDVFVAVGTSAVVYPAAGLIPEARRAGARVIEINPDVTAASETADVTLRLPAADALAAVDTALSA